MICFRYIIVNILHIGDTNDDDDDDDNNNKVEAIPLQDRCDPEGV